MKGYGIAFKKKNYIYNNSQPTKYIYVHCIRIRPQIITETQNQSEKKKKMNEATKRRNLNELPHFWQKK